MSHHVQAFRVGLVIPFQGPPGLFAPSCLASATLAAEQVNQSGGICGRPVRLELIEGGGRPAQVANQVRRAVDDGVDAVTGWHISAVRQQIAPVLDGRIPYVYTSLYEGGEVRPGVICSGEVPEQQIRPAFRWLRDELGLRRWVIVGNDYIWPWASATAAHRFSRELGLSVVDEIFVGYGSQDLVPAVERVARASADAVLMLLVGQDAVLFNREFAARGLHAQLARFSPLMEENMLLASGVEATENLYAAAGYFSSLATPDALDLLGAYTERFGPDAPPLNNMAESCHEGILVLRELHRAARSCRLRDIVSVVHRVGFDGPRGPVSQERGMWRQRVYLAAANGFDFDVLAELRPAGV